MVAHLPAGFLSRTAEAGDAQEPVPGELSQAECRLAVRKDATLGLRIFRRIRILPGVRVNVSKSGPSISVGRRGAVTTLSLRGRRTTFGVPGSGVSYSTYKPWPPKPQPVRVCNRCGYTAGASAKYCGKCGQQL
jgi:Protein of unknown function (DUF4236)